VIEVCLSGAAGRMGRMLAGLVEAAADLRLAAALEQPGHPELGTEVSAGVVLVDDARKALSGAGVLLDFSTADAAAATVRLAGELGVAVVCGVTGFSDAQQDTLRQAAGRVAVVWGSNMSRGVHLLTRLAEKAAGQLDGYDAEVFEIHHRNKADAPSGTALQLAGAIRDRRGRGTVARDRRGKRGDDEVGVCAARGGDVVGEHQVMFLGPGEQVILTHRATSREHFCRGALDAVRFAARSSAGLYTMADVFREEP